ncbi:MAG TPA: argininosuccinate synthase domain-containing protein [Jatrophihabitans sp.]|nr:argininosuccinate synthase domain-containing protein [Jatrophihabitans sp.]
MQTLPLSDRRIGVPLSGGLSSLAVAAKLQADGRPVLGLAAFVGQCSPAEFAEFTSSVRAGGIEVREVDLTDSMATAAFDVLAHHACYDGGYWNTTSMSREVLVAGLAGQLRAAGCSVLAHGCVGGGNDQRRFERNGARYLPEVEVYAAWREAEMQAAMPDRAAMAKYLAERNLPAMAGNTIEHSIDGNLAGFSHEDTALEDLRTSTRTLQRRLGVPPEAAPDTVTTVRVRVERGRPVALDGTALPPAELLGRANELAGRHGLGLADVLENRVNGTKCRGVYEAPGMQLLSAAVEAAFETSTDRAAADLRRELSRVMAVAVYEATTGSVAALAARAGLEELAGFAGAEVELELHRGSVVGRTIHDFDQRAGIVQQRRLAGTGHNWQSAPLTVAAHSRNGN